MVIRGWVAALVVFLEACAVLILEILSVRLLAPYVGLTLQTTTCIIGAVLLGIAVGAAVGGRVADRTDPRYLVVGLLIVGGVLAFATVPVVRWLGPTALGEGTAGALKVTFVALVPVAAVLSAISPTVAHWRLQDLRQSGTIVGGLSAWGTAGALVGTFGTGYILVPLLPVSDSVFGVGILLVISGLIFAACVHLFSGTNLALIFLVSAMIGVSGLVLPKPCQIETDYHCVNVTRVTGYPNGRYLYLDTDRNSFIDLANPADLGPFHYSRWIAGVIQNYDTGSPISMLVVGGGAFTLPRWLAVVRPGSRSTTLEVDSQLISFDKQQLGLRTDPKLRAVDGDARLTIRSERSSSVDVVVGDAFSGLTVPWQLMTREWVEEVRRVLRPRGFYAVNMIDQRPLSLLRSEIVTIRSVFHYVQLITKPGSNGLPAGGNIIVLASKVKLPSSAPGSLVGDAVTYGTRRTLEVQGDPKILTDNYAPVEQLQTR